MPQGPRVLYVLGTLGTRTASAVPWPPRWPDAKGAVEVKPMLAGEASAAAIWVPRATLLDVIASAAARAGADLRYGT